MTEMLRTTDLEPCIEYLCKNYGANSLVAGKYIYKANDIKQAIKNLND